MTELKFIARIRNGYSGKFGIPRQSGLDGDDLSEIVFEKPYRQPAALKGIEGFSHLWLLWYFSEGKDKEMVPRHTEVNELLAKSIIKKWGL